MKKNIMISRKKLSKHTTTQNQIWKLWTSWCVPVLKRDKQSFYFYFFLYLLLFNKHRHMWNVYKIHNLRVLSIFIECEFNILSICMRVKRNRWHEKGIQNENEQKQFVLKCYICRFKFSTSLSVNFFIKTNFFFLSFSFVLVSSLAYM